MFFNLSNLHLLQIGDSRPGSPPVNDGVSSTTKLMYYYQLLELFKMKFVFSLVVKLLVWAYDSCFDPVSVIHNGWPGNRRGFMNTPERGI